MLRVVAQWSGFTGAPGFSNFYFAGPGETAAAAQAAANDVRTFFAALINDLPAGVTITVSPIVAVINPGDGVLSDEITVATAPASVVGTGAGAYAAPVGAVVNWRTSTVVAGRRLRGRTFLVPLQGGSFQTDGTLATGALGIIRGAAATLATVNTGAPIELVVWHRPVNNAGGSTAVVTSSFVPDKAAVLRSRRD